MKELGGMQATLKLLLRDLDGTLEKEVHARLPLGLLAYRGTLGDGTHTTGTDQTEILYLRETHTCELAVVELPLIVGHSRSLVPLPCKRRYHARVDKEKQSVPPYRYEEGKGTVVLEYYRQGDTGGGEDTEVVDVGGQIGET